MNTLKITNSTITGNRCGDNGGGLRTEDVDTINNTIIAGNFRGATGTTPDDINGTIESASHNVIGHAGTSGGITGGVNGNIVGNGGTGTLDINTILNTTLANNGGPTDTHALVCGSVAIDAGDNAAAPASDQRGLARIVDGDGNSTATIDIGAYEKQNACPTITPVPASLQKNSSLTAVQIATVSDAEDAEDTLTVKVNSGSSATVNNVTVSIVDVGSNGSITANVNAPCNATTASFTLSVTDSAMQTVEATLNVTVTASNAPSFTFCPTDITKSNDAGKCSAVVTFTPTATDDCNGAMTPVCSPASGTAFPKGTTTVTCTVTDSDNQTATCSFNVTVNDTQAPSITTPANITQAAALGSCAATVSYTASANDHCDGSLVPVCSPSSGSSFPKGTTTVTCTASDSSGNPASKSFLVTINDMQNPTIACPSNMVVVGRPGNATVIVNYPAPVAGDNCGAVNVVCTPPSGSAFPVGTTTVTCTATDAAGNTASCGFVVTAYDVCLQDDGSSATVLQWNSLTGDYRLCRGGVITTGKGTVSRKGNIFTLTHNSSDRRVSASVDAGMNKGTATLQVPISSPAFTITDRDTRNNTCQCVSN